MARSAMLLTITITFFVYVHYLVYAQEFTECTNEYSDDKGVCFTNITQKCSTYEFAFANGGSICKTYNETDHNLEGGVFYHTYPIYCCPYKEQFNETGQRANAVCDYYNSQLWSWDAAYNGIPALIEEFSHMAALGYNETENLIWGCSGSIISPTFVLTAAHCLKSQFGQVSLIRTATTDLSDNSQFGKGLWQTDFPVLEIIAHPKYKRPSHYYDIGLIRTEFIKFSPYAFPACLYTSHNVPNNQFSATGWGKTDFINGENTKLLKVALNLVETLTCRNRYATASKKKLADNIDEETQVCAGHPLGNDPCPGDSGGPLQMSVSPQSARSHYRIVGITAFGKGCGQTDSIGVYTKVASFVRWIEDIVWPI